MNRTLFLAGIGILFFAVKAHGGYGDMKKELESYAPPAYLMSLSSYPPGTGTLDDIPSPVRVEKLRIEQLRSRWEKALSARDTTGFYRPSQSLPAGYEKTVHNSGTTAAYLATGASLQGLERITLFRNPAVKSAESRYRAAMASFGQVANLEEILRTYSAYTGSLSPGMGPMKGSGKISVKTSFPYPGVLSLKGQVVNQAVHGAWHTLEAARRDAVTAVRKTYWDLRFNRKARKITRETLALLNHLESVATTRYEAGSTSYQDVIKIRIQKEELGEGLVSLKESRKNLALKVFELADLTPDNRLGALSPSPPPSTVPPLKPLFGLALENRQELGRLRAGVGKAERMIEMAETLILPPYTMNLSLYGDAPALQAGASATRPAFATSITATRGAGLPRSPWYGTEDAYLRQTRHKLAALRNDLKTAESVTRTMVREAWYHLDRAAREERLYRNTVVALSRSALDTATQGYEAGRVTFADVIGSYTEWLTASLALERRQRDLGTSWAELARVVGLDITEIKKSVSNQEQGT